MSFSPNWSFVHENSPHCIQMFKTAFVLTKEQCKMIAIFRRITFLQEHNLKNLFIQQQFAMYFPKQKQSRKCRQKGKRETSKKYFEFECQNYFRNLIRCPINLLNAKKRVADCSGRQVYIKCQIVGNIFWSTNLNEVDYT